MQYALAYTAAGTYLQLHPVAAHGVENANQLLHWDNLEMVLDFVTYGGLPCFYADGSNPAAKYGPYSARLLRAMLDYINDSFPSSFVFQHHVEETALPRLPAGIDYKLRQQQGSAVIQFGDVPPEELGQSPANQLLLSRLLLSFPFEILRMIFDSVDYNKFTLEHRVRVIQERERRRKLAYEEMASTGKWSEEEKMLLQLVERYEQPVNSNSSGPWRLSRQP
jgi:hypothetical protein